MIGTPALVKPPLGVTVIVDIPLLPAVTVTALPARVREPVPDTVTVIAVAEDSA